MVYGHKGAATDNAFTTVDGVPTRGFLAFENKEALVQAQDKIYQGPDGDNLIPCTRKFVEKWAGRDFVTLPNGSVMSRREYDENQDI